LPLCVKPPQWAVSSLFIGDSNDTHQSGFDDFDEKRRSSGAVFAEVFILAQIPAVVLQLGPHVEPLSICPSNSSAPRQGSNREVNRPIWFALFSAAFFGFNSSQSA
jgi:hypothetical protein